MHSACLLLPQSVVPSRTHLLHPGNNDAVCPAHDQVNLQAVGREGAGWEACSGPAVAPARVHASVALVLPRLSVNPGVRSCLPGPLTCSMYVRVRLPSMMWQSASSWEVSSVALRGG